MTQLTSRELEGLYRRARRVARQRHGSAPIAGTRPVFTLGSAPGASGVRVSNGGSKNRVRLGTSIGRGDRIKSGRSGVGWMMAVCVTLLGAFGFLFRAELVGDQVAPAFSEAIITETSTGAVDGLAWTEMLWAKIAGDEDRLAELSQTGYLVTLESGTAVQVLDTGLISRRVRPVDGESPIPAAWVPARVLKER